MARRLYNRLESTTQSPEVARLQEERGELWGGVPRWGVHPAVQAYDGPLPAGRRGIEFTTDVEPDVGHAPGLPTWRGPRPGVTLDGDVAKIKITVTKNTQSPRAS